MPVKAHISSVHSACRGHLRNIGSIRHYLMQKPAASLVHFLITARLDYANARLFGVHRNQTVCLQNMQNYAARIVTRTSTSDHIMPVLYMSCTCKVPHWTQGAKSNIQGTALTCTSISVGTTHTLRSDKEPALCWPTSTSCAWDLPCPSRPGAMELPAPGLSSAQIPEHFYASIENIFIQ